MLNLERKQIALFLTYMYDYLYKYYRASGRGGDANTVMSATSAAKLTDKANSFPFTKRGKVRHASGGDPIYKTKEKILILDVSSTFFKQTMQSGSLPLKEIPF
jgi:hypothetical protein